MDKSASDDEETLDSLIDSLTIASSNSVPRIHGVGGRARSSFLAGASEEVLENRYTTKDGDAVVNTLRKHYIYSQNRAIKKNTGATAFSHCGRNGPVIAKEYYRLRQLMQQHAVLKLTKDCHSRIQQFEIFNRNIKKLVQEEAASWHAIHQSTKENKDLEDHQTNLTALSSLCDEFRMHLNHWVCIKQAIHNNRWLSPLQADLLPQLQSVNVRLVHLQEEAIWWTDKLLRTGMHVFAYVDRHSLTYNDVFAIVRGIEEYNTLISLVANQSVEMLSSSLREASLENYKLKAKLIPAFHKSSPILSTSMKPVQFFRLLNSLATEWAKSAVHLARHFTDYHAELFDAMRRQRCSPDSAYNSPSSSPTDLTTSQPSHADSSANETKTLVSHQRSTSDYSSHMTEDGQPMRLHGGIDFTNHASPLLEFGTKERDYIVKVIQIACQRTTLLRRHKTPCSHHANTSSALVSDLSIVSEDGSETPGRSDTKRKSVSWGDSYDVTVTKQLTAKYDEALWKAFSSQLTDCYQYELHWGKTGRARPQVGCLDLSTPAAIAIFKRSITHAAHKGFFTSSATPHLTPHLSLLDARYNFAAFDLAFAECIASFHTDKAVPVPSQHAHHCTRTAMLIRNAILIIRSHLGGLNGATRGAHHNGKPLPSLAKHSPAHESFMDYSVRREAVNRLLALASLAYRWCTSKANYYLSTYKVPTFVLIIHGDAEVLISNLRQCCKLLTGDLMTSSLLTLTSQLDRLQDYAGSNRKIMYHKACQLSKQVLSTHMPPNKSWKQKTVRGEGRLKIQEYAHSLINSVLLPVADGAKHLSPTEQYNVMETITRAVCLCWQQYFLDRRVKFSLQGAEQLDVDFSYLFEFFDGHVPDSEVCNKLSTSASVLEFLRIINCLKDQPRPTPKTSQIILTPHRNRIHPEMEMKIEGQEKWLALRLDNPNRTPFSLLPCLALCNRVSSGVLDPQASL